VVVPPHWIRIVMARRLLQITTGMIAGMAAVALATLLGWLPFGRSPTPDPNLLAGYLPTPDLRLTTHAGAPFQLKDTEGLSIVFFGYTHCPDVCPLTLAKLRQAIDSLDRDRELPQVIFVTVDPARDTPARLAEYLEPLQPGFTGLTGTEEEISLALADWGIYRELSDGGADYVVDHTARAFVVDPTVGIRATFPPDSEPAAMVRTLRILLDER